MKLLKCKLCYGEMDIVGNEHSIHKKVKCQGCGFTNLYYEHKSSFEDTASKKPEVVVIKRRKL